MSEKVTEIWQLWVSKEDADKLFKLNPGKVEVLSHSLGEDGKSLMFISIPRNLLLATGGVPREHVAKVPVPPDIPCAQQHMDILEGQLKEMQATAATMNEQARKELEKLPVKGMNWTVDDSNPTANIPLPIIHSDFTFAPGARKVDPPKFTEKTTIPSEEQISAMPRKLLTIPGGLDVRQLDPPHTGSKYLRQIRSKDRKTTMVVDVYCVATAFNVTHMGLQHALKKILCPGIRGGKSYKQDLIEARDALGRAIEDAE